MAKSRVILLVVLLAVLAGVAGFGVFKVLQFRQQWRDATERSVDLARYGEYLGILRAAGLAGHFPAAAPANTTGFVYNPGFLQGSLVLQLKCQLTASELEQAAAMIAAQEADAQAQNRPVDPDPPALYDYTVPTSSYPEIDASYEMHLLEAEAHGEDSFPWNHGKREGFVLDRENGILLYFAEEW